LRIKETMYSFIKDIYFILYKKIIFLHIPTSNFCICWDFSYRFFYKIFQKISFFI